MTDKAAAQIATLAGFPGADETAQLSRILNETHGTRVAIRPSGACKPDSSFAGYWVDRR